jgi:probable HAF family extracellular repeat protein
MRARMANNWTKAWGLALLSLGIFYMFPAQAQQDAPTAMEAQPNKTQNHVKHHHYKLIDIGGLGGPNSFVTYGGITSKSINSRGIVVGNADTSTADPYCLVPSCLLNHAFRWRNGVVTDLGALPGGNNSFAFGINDRGWVAGVSENGLIDPMTGSPEVRAILWKDDEIINLGTLGGNASGANAVNNRGQVVGGALNTISAPFPNTLFNTYIFEAFPFYFFPLGTESRAFLWQDGRMQDLGTLGGPDSVAWFVNERGQVAGQSSIDSIPNSTTLIPTVDPFLWDHGKMVDVGSLGGTYGYVAGLNNRGQMIGTMNLPGDLTYHPYLWSGGVLTDLGTFGADYGEANAINEVGEVVGWASDGNGNVFSFLWRDGVMTNLGTVDGDPCNVADGINSNGQIVGESSPSCFGGSGPPGANAFLWEKGGPMVDLNTLIPPGSGIELATGASINDRGEIDARGVLPNGGTHAVILIPCDEDHADVEECDYSLKE